jgi:hypothetical protein
VSAENVIYADFSKSLNIPDKVNDASIVSIREPLIKRAADIIIANQKQCHSSLSPAEIVLAQVCELHSLAILTDEEQDQAWRRAGELLEEQL